MSKAFTKDDAADDAPIVPSRAPLARGVPNYVTPSGLAALRAELHELEAERAALGARAEGSDRRHASAALAARQAELGARIGSAVVVDPASQPHDEVRFGATVTVVARAHDDAAVARSYRIVGVDEADVAHGSVAFVAPLARALLGKRVGDVATLRTPRGEEELEVVSIVYEARAS